MRVAIAYSAQRQTPDTDLTETVEALQHAIAALGHQALPMPLGYDSASFLSQLKALQPDVCWNLCEEASGRAGRELHAAALVELGDAPVTGTSAATLSLCLDKSIVRHVLRGAGVAVPDAVLVEGGGELPQSIPLPAIVKPACQDGSVGIDRDSVGHDRAAVLRAVERLHKSGWGPALVEQYIEGRELNVLLLGPAGGPVAHVALGEIELDGLPEGEPRILTYAGKWEPDSDAYQKTPARYPANVDAELAERLRAMGERVFRALKLSGYARMDVRVAADGNCYVIDVNGNPDISPDAGLQRALPSLGLDFPQFVALQLGWAHVR
jgi:D-alanine-D-alanine ligase